ncbi:O-methyltransferase [Bacillus sp. REN10]|uniref:O-methyltransferase n=1 Tax=Bacillus sp. REN10 TaxID=2782541 RepID=UPI001EED8861|nr:O-methyltransferase [Bacillus sp. REN10]
MDDKIHHYIETLVKDRSDLFVEMEDFARENRVPIMEVVGIEALLQMLRLQKPKKILEIGTAIGYSALRMAAVLPGTEIVTIERDSERYQKALHYIERAAFGDQVNVIYGDALEVVEEIGKKGPYDAIFIDAAKGQYTKFFKHYTAFLTEQGTVYTDNVLFKGYVAEELVQTKRTRNLVKKIQKYNEWLMTHPDYDTAIIPVGDGLAVSLKRGGKKDE